MRNKLIQIFSFFFAFLGISFLTFFAFSSPVFAAQATILLDPGHSSIISSKCDQSQSKGVYDDPYNIYDDDYPNCPEITEAMDIANWLEKKLKADGYNVIMTKTAWNAPTFVSLWDRAQQANNANADLAVSIHDDHGQSWNSFAQVYVQNTNYYRVNKNGQHITFAKVAGANATDIANKSQAAGQKMADARSAAEGHKVSVAIENFGGRAPLAAGNIPQVQLYSKVPWIYNEVGGKGINISKYEQGILNGIEKAITPNGGSGGNNNSNNGNIATSNCVVTAVGNAPANPSLPAACLSGSPDSTGGGNQSVVAWAKARVNTATYIMGTPSRNWASDPNNPPHFDCSGYVGEAWYKGTKGKVSMYGQTCSDWNDSTGKYQKFMPNQLNQIEPGDLVYFTGGDPCFGARPGDITGPGHVVMYEGAGSCGGAKDCVLEYYRTGRPGKEDSLAAHMKEDHMWGFLRPK